MRAKRIDHNQTQIVKAFRMCGFSVFVTSSIGNGFPDLAVGKNNTTYLIEVKNGSNPLSKQKLTEKEQEFFDSWHGHAEIITSVDDVVKFVARC